MKKVIGLVTMVLAVFFAVPAFANDIEDQAREAVLIKQNAYLGMNPAQQEQLQLSFDAKFVKMDDKKKQKAIDKINKKWNTIKPEKGTRK